MSKKELRRVAAELIMHWVGEAHHDLDGSYYKKLLPGEKEMVKFYIHLYGTIIGVLLRCRYELH